MGLALLDAEPTYLGSRIDLGLALIGCEWMAWTASKVLHQIRSALSGLGLQSDRAGSQSRRREPPSEKKRWPTLGFESLNREVRSALDALGQLVASWKDDAALLRSDLGNSGEPSDSPLGAPQGARGEQAAQYEAIAAQMQHLQKREEKLSSALRKAQATLNALQKEKADAHARASQLEQQCATLNDKLAELRSQPRAARSTRPPPSMGDDPKSREAFQQEIKRREEAEQRIAQLQGAHDKAMQESEQRLASLQEQTKIAAQQAAQSSAQRDNNTQELEKLRREIEQHAQASASLQQSVSEAKDQRTRTEQQLAEMQARVKASEAETTRTALELEALMEKLEDAQIGAEQARSQYTQASQQLSETQQKLAAAEAFADRCRKLEAQFAWEIVDTPQGSTGA